MTGTNLDANHEVRTTTFLILSAPFSPYLAYTMYDDLIGTRVVIEAQFVISISLETKIEALKVEVKALKLIIFSYKTRFGNAHVPITRSSKKEHPLVDATMFTKDLPPFVWHFVGESV